MKNSPFRNANISKTKNRCQEEMYKRYVANGLKLTCTEFGVKMFVRVRDTAVNIIYYSMGGSGSFLHRES